MVGDSLFIGQRLRLSALALEDLPVLVRWQEDPAFLRLLDARPAFPRSKESLAAWLEERHKSSDGYLFGIRQNNSDTLVGYAELEGILWNHQVGWITVVIGERDLRGQGYGQEAMELLLRFAFGELNLHRLQLTVFSYNTRAIALYKRLGFQREGVYREFLHRDGQRYDMYLYGLLRREWECVP